jgi:beta-lactamase class A
VIALAIVFSQLRCASAAPPDLARDVDRILARHRGKTIAVAYYDLRDGTALYRSEREVFHAASTMKVPVMLGIFEAVSSGELRLDQPVRVRNEFVSIFDGSRYALDPKEDSDGELYDLVDRELPLEELVRRMIVRSSNLATNIVIELIGAPRVMALMREIGANDIRVLRGVEDDKAYRAGMNNTTTAYDLMLIFRTLGESRAISTEASQRMIDILAGQEHNDGIPVGLPKGVRVAHKTGSITGIAHDGGLVLTPDRGAYVLVVLTRGFRKNDEADRVIASISRAVWRSRPTIRDDLSTVKKADEKAARDCGFGSDQQRANAGDRQRVDERHNGRRFSRARAGDHDAFHTERDSSKTAVHRAAVSSQEPAGQHASGR